VIFGSKKKPKLEELISTAVAGPLLDMAKLGHDGHLPTLPVNFVFVLVSHPEAGEFHRLASDAIRIGVAEHVMLVANAGGLLQFAVGPSTHGSNSATSQTFVSALVKALGGSARVVYGTAQAHIGAVGPAKRKTWGFHPLAIEAILSSLLAASPGQPVALGAL
jgi:hypothetical protein